MIRYRAMELHTHTLHSDGQFSVEQLCRKAVEWQYEGIALTDHNTMSGLQDLTAELAAETLPVIPGIEWTTFFGHMLVIGADRYIDWRFALPEDIDRHIQHVKDVGGIVGLAHPMDIGSPMVTGGHWNFRVQNWANVSYIEIWNEPEPQTKLKSCLAHRMWTDLLNRGHHLAATAGRDWHGIREGQGFDTVAPVTYLGLPEGEISTDTVRQALAYGRTYVTMGPGLALSVLHQGRDYGIGDTLPAGLSRICMAVDTTSRRTVWGHLGIEPRELRLVGRGGTLWTAPWEGSALECDLGLEPGWLRLEVYGTCRDLPGELLAFTSPLYIE